MTGMGDYFTHSSLDYKEQKVLHLWGIEYNWYQKPLPKDSCLCVICPLSLIQNDTTKTIIILSSSLAPFRSSHIRFPCSYIHNVLPLPYDYEPPLSGNATSVVLLVNDKGVQGLKRACHGEGLLSPWRNRLVAWDCYLSDVCLTIF